NFYRDKVFDISQELLQWIESRNISLEDNGISKIITNPTQFNLEWIIRNGYKNNLSDEVIHNIIKNICKTGSPSDLDWCVKNSLQLFNIEELVISACDGDKSDNLEW